MKSFAQLKLESLSGAALARLQDQLRYDLGTHKLTRLRLAGRADSMTLLHNTVSADHAKLLLRDYRAHCGKGFDRDRLRFLTILHSSTPCDAEQVLRSERDMRRTLTKTLKRVGVWALGASELELVSASFLRRFESQSDDVKRKLQTVLSLANGNYDYRLILVHCHVLVDLGEGDLDEMEAMLREELTAVTAWRRAAYQIELKSTFKKRSLSQNLKGIAEYLTKGGNEQLRYKAGYGRDLAEDLDAKIWRAGLGRKDGGADTVEDERGLAIGEVEFLDRVYEKLMRSRPDGRGYLISNGD